MKNRKYTDYEWRLINSVADETGIDRFTSLPSIILSLRRAAKKLQRIAENECNGWPRETTEIRDGKMYRFPVTDEKWQARDERAEENTKRRVQELCKENNLIAEFQGDPRGAVLSVKTKSGISLTDLLY
jgi:hypothetical protein